MSDLWGFQSGQQQRQADDQSKGLYELRMAEGEVDLQTKQLTYQNAQLMNQRQEQAIKMMQLAQPKGGGSPGDPGYNPTAELTDTLFQIANADFAAGLPEQGLAAVKQASTLQANHSKIAEQTTMDQIRRFSFLSNSLTEVHDQQSWDQAKMIFQSNFPGQLDQRIAQLPYSPELIKQLSAGTSTALQKANAGLSKARADEVKVNEELARARVPYVKEQTRLTADRADQIEKAGGKPPAAREVNLAKDRITKDYPDIEKPDADTMGLQVAMEAKKYPNLPLLEATEKAYKKLRKQGKFFGLRPGRVRAGTSTKNPMPGAMQDVSKMKDKPVDNMIYDGKGLGHPGEFYAWDADRNGWMKVVEGDTVEDEPDEKDDE